MNRLHNKQHAFTIVELLVVIVVIGILAAVTIVSYTGISNKANTASVQLDLSNASTLLKMYYTEYGSYPIIASGSNCPSNPVADTKYCLKLSPNNTKTYSPSTGTNSQSYSLNITNTNSNTLGVVTNDSKPIIPTSAPLSPVADWIALPTGDHQGSYYDLVSKTWGATVTRNTPKTIYDPNTQKIYDVDANQLAINPRSDGKSGYEAVIEESRTNYLLNSSFETDSNSDGMADNWSIQKSYASGVTNYSRVAGVHGSYAQKITYMGNPSDPGTGYVLLGADYTQVGTFAPGDTMTASFFAKGSWSGISSLRLMVVAITSDGSWISSNQVNMSASVNNFTKYNVTYSNLPVNTSKAWFLWQALNVTPTANIDISIDAIQLEKGTFATSYIQTTTTAITRSADVVKIPTTNWVQSQGTFVMIRGATPTASSNILVADANGALGLNTTPTTASTYVYDTSAHIASKTYSTTPFVQTGTWQDGTYPAIYVDGVQSLASTAGSNTFEPLATYARIGSHPYSVGWFNGPIQRVIIYSTAHSSTDVLNVANSIKDGP